MRFALLGAILLVVGCSPDYKTEQVRITLADDVSGGLCAGDLRHFQDEVDRIEETLGMKMSKPVDLVYFGVWADCKRSSEGCYSSSRHRIKTNPAAVSHELVHAVTGGCNNHNCERFFEEGVAVALSGHVRFPYIASLPSENLNRSSSPAVDYETAGHFMRWLLEEQGAAKIRQLLDGGHFDTVYGESLQSAETRWLRSAPWLYPAHAPCPAAPLTVEGDGWHETVDVDCHGEDVRSGATETMWLCRTFEIESEGLYLYESDARSWIERCQQNALEQPPPIDREAVPAAHNYNRPLQFFEPGQEHEALFRSGVHMVCIAVPVQDTAITVELSLSPTATTLVRP